MFKEIYMGAHVSQKVGVYFYPKIWKDSGQVYLYLGSGTSFNPKVPKVQEGQFFLQIHLCSISDPKFLQIHLMPDRQRKPLRCERYRDDRISHKGECHRRAVEKKNISIAWNYGSAFINFFLFVDVLHGLVLWWVVEFGFGKLGKVVEIITSVVEMVTRGSFILPRFFFNNPILYR